MKSEDQIDALYSRVTEVATRHLEACFDAMNEGTASPAVAPFDGCMTCIVREVLLKARDDLFQIARLESELAEKGIGQPAARILFYEDHERDLLRSTIEFDPPFNWEQPDNNPMPHLMAANLMNDLSERFPPDGVGAPE